MSGKFADMLIFDPVKFAEFYTKEHGGGSGAVRDVRIELSGNSILVGKWKESDHGSYLCSNCDFDWVLNDGTPDENGMNFCPNCGARMYMVIEDDQL